jgi:hypothetical protein
MDSNAMANTADFSVNLPNSWIVPFHIS